MFYVYLLKSKKDSKLYIGYTNDLKRRLEQHNNQESFSTKSRAPFELVYYEAFLSEKDAHNRENSLKHFGQGLGRLKERLEHSLGVKNGEKYVRG